MGRNEFPMMAASYFWSDALNAFMFGHGPMTPTLADFAMLTGLDVSSSHNAYNLLSKGRHKFETKGSGGWKGFIGSNAKEGSVDDREHTAFLMMWLEKFIFCGKSVAPTANFQPMAEALVNGDTIPLGQHLLRSVYTLLHHVPSKLSTGQPIGNPGGPWCFINL